MAETRHQFLKRIINKRIDELPSGARLSTELELCAEFSVSRMTVNKVICELEKEGLVTRIRHRGTFVRRKARKASLITFLLPCPGSFTMNDSASVYRRKLLSGVMRAIRETGSRLETISVSPSNSMEDIDFSSLDHLNRESRVIVGGVWYAPVFETLYRYSCRVCLLDDQVLYSYLSTKKFADGWLIGDMDVKQAVYDLTLKLHRRGCRRIAIMSPYLQYKGHARTEGYRAALRETGLPELMFTQDKQSTGALKDEEIEFLHRNRCDAVLLDAAGFFGVTGDSLNDILGLPAAIRVGAFYFNSEFNFLQEPPLSFVFDYEEMGYESAMRLLSDGEEPRYKLYPAIFTNNGNEES